LDEYKRILNLPQTKAKINQFKGLMSNLTRLTGKIITTTSDIFFLYHTFAAQSSLGLTLPRWAYDYFPHGLLLDATVAEYDIINFTPLLRRLSAGKCYIYLNEYIANTCN